MTKHMPKKTKDICQSISRGPNGPAVVLWGYAYPGGPNGPAVVLWDTQGGVAGKCAVSQDPAVVGPATQLPPYHNLRSAMVHSSQP
jgi:hypothetical protein